MQLFKHNTILRNKENRQGVKQNIRARFCTLKMIIICPNGDSDASKYRKSEF
jgi:hypothetical protein